MDFTFTDIFDTKGIEYIIVIFFLLLVIPFWQLLNRPLKAGHGSWPAVEGLHASLLRIPRGLFFHRNHTWSSLERSGLASMGLSDLLVHLTGGVSVDYLVKQGEEVKSGDVVAKLVQGNKHLQIRTPLTGKISSLNDELAADPHSLQDPYKAWLCRIDPGNWKEESGQALLAGEAEQWAGEELDRFKDFLAEKAAGHHGEVVLQEGGALADQPLSEMDQEVWVDFQEHFLEDQV